MKASLKIALLFFLILLSSSLKAQADERNKITMQISFEGKNITSELASVGMGISRYKDYTDPTKKDAVVSTDKSVLLGTYYLTLGIKKVSTDLLKVFSKKETVFNGTITITDTYGKNPQREIKFANASLESYSDQFSTASYDDAYSSSAISLSEKGLSLNGVVME